MIKYQTRSDFSNVVGAIPLVRETVDGVDVFTRTMEYPSGATIIIRIEADSVAARSLVSVVEADGRVYNWIGEP